MVIALTTTYRHDYKQPITNRYNFLGKDSAADGGKKVCTCASVPAPGKPAAQPSTLKSEWTGIAPMGRLIDPRIIPEPSPFDQEKASPCQRDQPNRFLKILKTCYPELYERLQNMPHDELERRIDGERLRTTYQVDYCHMSEYPEGLYKSMEEKKPGQQTSELKDGCEQFRDEVKTLTKSADQKDDCLAKKSPGMAKKMSFADSSKTSPGGDSGHWGVEFGSIRKPRITEYMDKINRTACVIVKNNIHDHSGCKKAEDCNHALKHTCTKITVN